VVLDEDVPVAINAIVRNARTGETGDGKTFVLPVEGVVRVRTGDRDENAIQCIFNMLFSVYLIYKYFKRRENGDQQK
jgi:ERCC4-related helicase